jgi:hypothetical protein
MGNEIKRSESAGSAGEVRAFAKALSWMNDREQKLLWLMAQKMTAQQKK